MCIFTLESTHFIFHKCPIYTQDGASAKFSTNSHETDCSVGTEGRPDETSCYSSHGRAGPVILYNLVHPIFSTAVRWTLKAFWLGKIEQLYEIAHWDIAEYGRNRYPDYSITVTLVPRGRGRGRGCDGNVNAGKGDAHLYRNLRLDRSTRCFSQTIHFSARFNLLDGTFNFCCLVAEMSASLTPLN